MFVCRCKSDPDIGSERLSVFKQYRQMIGLLAYGIDRQSGGQASTNLTARERCACVKDARVH